MRDVTNALLSELQLFAQKLNELEIEPIIGGGMGLYLRQTRIGFPETGRYNIVPPLRPTQDIDTFISGDVIVDGEKWRGIRAVLDNLDWVPDEKFLYGHFLKGIDGTKQTIKLDLLSSIPDDTDLVQLKGLRIRPLGPQVQLHARITEEAAGIELDPISLELDNGSRILIPSSFNYMILKLHAFRDSVDDERKKFGQHHALDIFRTTLMMRPEDWTAAAHHNEKRRGATYLAEAARICNQFFNEPSSMGVIRLKENERYQERRVEYDAYVSLFLEDLSDLFELGQV